MVTDRICDPGMNERKHLLTEWLDSRSFPGGYSLTLASGDASFRRYFRITADNRTYIVMDAPPDKEDCTAYLDITERLQACGVTVPDVIDRDIKHGFLLLSDLGTRHYLDTLTEENADKLYALALEALAKIQHKGVTHGLPPYDDTLLTSEMQLFTDWLLGEHLNIKTGRREQGRLLQIFNILTENALAQPRVFVHRDYHSRNLMVMDNTDHRSTPGMLDFQDAVNGPLTYDLVSLLKDCYIKWPRDRIRRWALDYHRDHCHGETGSEEFLRQFDLMGVQRHLKASGIFARLYHRDGKAGYLADIPRTLSYITDLAGEYSELGPLVKLIEQRVTPVLKEANAACAP
ncbi:MAG TPA: phosphotransferase [Gammaproteobacteria bacterium]|nr:phosphotransferase [Gammaproteobacteria bacterium]